MEDLAPLQISFRCVHVSTTLLCKDEDNASIELSSKSPIITIDLPLDGMIRIKL